MKKFISMAMVAAMTTSMVPATAFAAAGDDVAASVRIVKGWEKQKDDPQLPNVNTASVPEVQMVITKADQEVTFDKLPSAEVTLTLDNAEFLAADLGDTNPNDNMADFIRNIKVTDKDKANVLGTAYVPGGQTTTYTQTAATATLTQYIKDYLAGKNDGKEVYLYTGSAGTTNVATYNAANTVAAQAATVSKYSTTPLVEFITALDQAVEAGKCADISITATTFDTATDWSLTRNNNGDQVLVDGSGTNAPVPYSVATATLGKTVGDFTGVEKAYATYETDVVNALTAMATSGKIWAKETSATTGVDGSFTDENAAGATGAGTQRLVVKSITVEDKDEITIEFAGRFVVGDIITIDLPSVMDKVNKDATVSVSGDFVEMDNMTYVDIMGKGITASTKKTVAVAEEEITDLTDKGILIEAAVDNSYKAGDKVTLKLSKGFEFVSGQTVWVNGSAVPVEIDDDKLTFAVPAAALALDEMKVQARRDVDGDGNTDTTGLRIEATSAKAGDIATMKVTVGDNDPVTVEVATVCDYTVLMSVDEDEDVPEYYAGTDVANTGLTVDDDHMSLEVTIEESFPGAWSMRQGFDLELPDGVYVTDVKVNDVEGLTKDGAAQFANDVEKAFYNAYQDGDHKNFEFDKRVFDDVDNTLGVDEAKLSFELELVADPTFVGDVTLRFTGDLVDEQEVTIARFVPFAEPHAEQNDLKIDYRYTEVPTAITLTEAEPGLWEEGSKFWMAIDRGDMINFEDDAVFETTGDLEIDDFEKDMPFKSIDEDETIPAIGFEVEGESDEAATVTISGLSLFMQRNIPAGAYDLIGANSVTSAYLEQQLFAPDCNPVNNGACTCNDKDNDCFVKDVEDFSDVVKEAFVNIVTAGREQDDASFTTMVKVPVGESYIVSGDKTIELDVPAYVSAAGYTMLPVRAVATALGINSNNVIWNGETKTVTILYGQRIITMTAGQKVVNVNGSAIPASAAVEITEGRTFLPMRDLATALGVTDITWDAATKTATLNGGVVAE